jgi:hypothetical protein
MDKLLKKVVVYIRFYFLLFFFCTWGLVSVLELIGVDLALLVIVDVLGHLPHLHDVVLGHRADHPGLVGVPREVGDLGGVASVNELNKEENAKK